MNIWNDSTRSGQILSNRPNKNTAVIFDADREHNISIGDFVKVCADIVGPRSITYASRISGGRVCVYLNCEQSVVNVTSVGSISVKNVKIPVRRYISKATRIILSNVLPDIDNELLERNLSRYGKVVSPIREITLGSQFPELAHVKSFRRLVYVVLNEGAIIPQRVNTAVDGQPWTIFLTIDDALCYRCKHPGHVSRDCPGREEKEDDGDTTTIPPATIDQEDVSHVITTLTITPKHQRRSVAIPDPDPSKDLPSSSPTITGVELCGTPKHQRRSVAIPDPDPSKELPSSDSSPTITGVELCGTPKHQRRSVAILDPDPSKELPSSESSPASTGLSVLPDDKMRRRQRNDGVASGDSEYSSDTSSRGSRATLKLKVDDADAIKSMCQKLTKVTSYPITTQQLFQLFQRTRGLKVPLPAMLDFTQDMTGLKSMLEDALVFAGNFNAKRRVQRLLAAIGKKHNCVR
jgi:Zinc knuckle